VAVDQVPDVSSAVSPVDVVAPVAATLRDLPLVAWAVLAGAVLLVLWIFRRW
jgi:hypothetical protein